MKFTVIKSKFSLYVSECLKCKENMNLGLDLGPHFQVWKRPERLCCFQRGHSGGEERPTVFQDCVENYIKEDCDCVPTLTKLTQQRGS